MMKNNSQQGGFLELIVIILVALILLRFLDIDAILTKAWVKEYITYTKEMLILVWRDIVNIFNAIKGN